MYLNWQRGRLAIWSRARSLSTGRRAGCCCCRRRRGSSRGFGQLETVLIPLAEMAVVWIGRVLVIGEGGIPGDKICHIHCRKEEVN